MSSFWRGFFALPLGIFLLALALAVLVGTWWIVSEKFLSNVFWREQRPLFGRRGARSLPVDQAALHLLARWAWGVRILPGVRIALYVNSTRPTDEEWEKAEDYLEHLRAAVRNREYEEEDARAQAA